MLEYAWLILLFPLAGVLVNALVGRWLSRRLVAAIASLAVGAAFVLAAWIFFEMLRLPADGGTGTDGRIQTAIPLFTWIVAGVPEPCRTISSSPPGL